MWRGIHSYTPHRISVSASQPLPEEQCGLGWTSRTMRKFILQRNVDVNVDRHFLLQRGHVLLGSGPEELSVSVGVWHVCQWKNFNELYACLGTSFCKRQLDATPDFVFQIDAGNYILDVCIFRRSQRSSFPKCYGLLTQDMFLCCSALFCNSFSTL